MADDNISTDDAAEAALHEVDAPEFDAEATDDGTEATQKPAEQSPGFNTKGLSDAELDALAERATSGELEEPEQQDGEGAEEETKEEDESDDAAKAAFTGNLPARISVKHLGEEAALVVKAGDISRKEKISFAEAAMRVGLFKAGQPADEAQATTPAAPVDNGQGTRDFAAELAEAEAAIEAAEAEEAEALTSFDKDRIAAAKKAVRVATSKAAAVERAKEQAESAKMQAFRSELDTVSANLPDKNAFYDFLDTLPNELVVPGKLEKAKRMFWAAEYPDKPYPAAKAAVQKTVTHVVRPKKNGTPVAAISANGRPPQPRGLAAVARNAGAVKQLTDEELDAALSAL